MRVPPDRAADIIIEAYPPLMQQGGQFGVDGDQQGGRGVIVQHDSAP